MASRTTLIHPFRTCHSAKVLTRPFSNNVSPLLASYGSPTRDLVSALADKPSYPSAIPPRQKPKQASTEANARMAQAMHAKNHKALQSLAQQRQQPQNAIDSANAIKRETRKRDLQIMSTRNWRNGDVYSPHDLSLVEIKRWKGKTRPEVDVFDTLALNPISEWKNYAMMSEFTTSMGRIKHPRDTGLRNVNQRRIAKAIRRAIGMGFLPSVHMHPEMLRRYDANLT